VVIKVECLVERCAGVDIGKADLKACVRVPGARGGRRQEIKTFATTTGALLRLRQWLVEQRVTVVAMEATGVIRGSNNFLPRFSRSWPSRTSP
jgi:hypothetical protein